MIDIIKELNGYGIEPVVTDAEADVVEVEKFYGLKLVPLNELKYMDAVVVAVAHDSYRSLSISDIDKMFEKDKILFDLKGIYDRKACLDNGYEYWRL